MNKIGKPVNIHVVTNLLRGSILSHSFSTFRNSVLSQFTRQQQSNGSLDFSGRDGGSFVVRGQSRSFRSNSFEDVVDKRVHDGHSLGGDTSIGVDLFQDFVDVDGKGFLPLWSSDLLLVRRGSLLDSFFRTFGGSHFGFLVWEFLFFFLWMISTKNIKWISFSKWFF